KASRHQGIKASRRRGAWILAVVLMLCGAARAQVVSETLGEGITRYFAGAEAREHALPSYALKEEIKGRPGAAGKVAPAFVTEGGQQTVTVVIAPGTSLYGTGEVSGPLVRNGRTVTTWNTDA